MIENKTNFFWSGALLLTAFIWGFAFIVVKESLDLVPTLFLLSARFSLAALILLVVLRKKIHLLDRRQVRDGIILGIFLFLAYVFQTYGCLYTTAGKNAFLTTLYCILVPFFNFLIFRKKVNAYHMSAAVLAIFGIALLTLQGSGAGTAGAQGGGFFGAVNPGDILTLICGVFFALQIVFTSKFTEKGDPILLTFVQLCVCGCLSIVSSLFIDGNPIELIGEINAEVVKSILFLAVFSTLICFLMQNLSQKHLHPVTASVLMSMESVFGILCSAIFLHEEITPRILAGSAIMFVAVLIAEVLGDNPELIKTVSPLRKADNA